MKSILKMSFAVFAMIVAVNLYATVPPDTSVVIDYLPVKQMTINDTVIITPPYGLDSFVVKPKLYLEENISESKTKRYGFKLISPKKITVKDTAEAVEFQFTVKRPLYSAKAIKDSYNAGESISGDALKVISPSVDIPAYLGYKDKKLGIDSVIKLFLADLQPPELAFPVADSYCDDGTPILYWNDKDTGITLSIGHLGVKSKSTRAGMKYSAKLKGWFEFQADGTGKIAKIPVKFNMKSLTQNSVGNFDIRFTAPALKNKIDTRGRKLTLIIDNGVGLASTEIWAIGNKPSKAIVVVPD